MVFPGPRIEKRASCGNFSSFNIGCERKSEKCILSYGHVLSIGTSHTNLVMMFGGIPGSTDLKTALLRPAERFGRPSVDARNWPYGGRFRIC